MATMAVMYSTEQAFVPNSVLQRVVTTDASYYSKTISLLLTIIGRAALLEWNCDVCTTCTA